jgi:hypothetical protein
MEGAASPLFMLVVDTSGSMERMPGCECTTASCAECFPDCSAASPDKNRWTQVLEALTGSYEDFECEALERTDDFATYDLGYPIPHFEPSGSQQNDGVLDELASSVRFGVATFDAVGTYGVEAQVPLAELDFAMSGSAAGMWSYPETDEATSSGRYSYPGTPQEHFMDTGIRSAQADDGALIVAVDPETAEARAADMQRTLLSARPYGSTPTAAALDDLYWLFAEDPELDDERADPLRERHVVLISDGRPDDDYRNVGCEDESFSCPYPLAEQAARALRCGDSEDCDEGVVTKVHVIAFSPEDDAREVLDAIASAGGTNEAVAVEDSAGLKAALSEIIDDASE